MRVVADEASQRPEAIMAPPRSAVSRGPTSDSNSGPKGMPHICDSSVKARTSPASEGPSPPSGDQYLREAGM